MEYFLQARDQSLTTMQNIIDDKHEKLVHNGDEVKEEIQAAFGQYIGWLRDRESQLLREVDRAIQSHLWRSQSNVCETLATLTTFKENVSLLDSDKASRDIKDQIDRLLMEMTSAVQKDVKSSMVVRFDENGRNTIRTAIDNCGEVYTETTEVPVASNVVATSTSKWAKWLQSSNFEQLEEPDMLYDSSFMGSVHGALRPSISQPVSSKEKSVESSKESVEVDPTPEAVDQFVTLMKSPLDQWLVPAAKRAETPRQARACPGKIGQCAHSSPDVEIENLGQLKCVTNIPNDLKTWLMQPDVVQLPSVAEICLGNQPCQKLSDCSSAAHCIGYFFTLSRRSEDWLAPEKTSSTKSESDLFEVVASRQSTPSCSSKSIKSEDFEVLSNASTAFAKSCVSDDLKLWLMSSSEPPADESEWLTIHDDDHDKQKKFHATSRIDEWLLKC